MLHRGQKEALAEFLPLDAENWITCGNALRLDWLSICPPTGTGVKLHADDLFHTPLDQTQIDFENEGGETYICGNLPYLGFTWQSAEQKAEIRDLLGGRTSSSGFLDYVAGWFIKAAGYQASTKCGCGIRGYEFDLPGADVGCLKRPNLPSLAQPTIAQLRMTGIGVVRAKRITDALGRAEDRPGAAASNALPPGSASRSWNIAVSRSSSARVSSIAANKSRSDSALCLHSFIASFSVR